MANFSFGVPATTTAATGFGSFSTPKPATGFGLPAPSFGATPASGSLTFGTAAATPAATSAPTSNFSFGMTPSTVTSTGNPPNTGTTPAPPSLFGTPATSTTSLTGLNFGTLATSTTAGFGATTSAPAIGLSFGTTTTSSSLLGSAPSGNLFGTKPLGTSVAPTSSTTSVNKGLGGLDVSLSNKGFSLGGTGPTLAKENLIPNELTQTIESFKEYVKTQKGFSSDIARGSARPLNRCAEDTASLMEMLTTLGGSVQRDRALADKLKQDTAKALQNAEIAQRTHDTPAGLQYENTAPLMFFLELVENFEQDLMLFRSQIETTEKHIHTMMTPRALTPQELTMAMNKIHESLIAVAGRLQNVHSKVQQQKEQYLNLRKYILKDSTNVFEEIKVNGKNNRHSVGKIATGPTPFGPGNKSFLSSTTLNANRQPSYGSANSMVWGSTLPSATNISINNSMKPPTASLNFNPPLNLTAPLSTNESTSCFQLQKPPIGNKRGKH
ncbi:GSCOCG00003239001-RA-CDS [Cotesia congregata]|uniref:Similar to Nup58: Nuclear pore complex protein Nup58 (Drosophila melanogaster) n=1 Tax=Cotesia congregata TaxID=51543 RepID=A0A8J2HN54_COTCN|nr:GSCOCG00003239001-RA-CDS [Cotesia congregata]CAG5103161.1 Similar to Nup58: Nuclear pore complex protein Nup58 (Drosophila melanogaster) [Cotesia congregata]